jgi:hypothetical protein
MLLAHRVSPARRVHLYGEPAEHKFRCANCSLRMGAHVAESIGIATI